MPDFVRPAVPHENSHGLLRFIRAATCPYWTTPEGGNHSVVQARAELDMLYRDVKAGRVTRRMAEADESRLLAVIIEADKLAQQSAMPPALVGRIGDEAEAAWKAADDAVKRQMIQAVADIPSQADRPGRPWRQKVRPAHQAR
jgi:hypothetical protein